MDLSLLNLVDQMVDAAGVAFYMLFWAGSNGWVRVDVALCMRLYDLSWELSTLNQPFLFLLTFPKLRRRLWRFCRGRGGRASPGRAQPERQSTLNSSFHLS